MRVKVLIVVLSLVVFHGGKPRAMEPDTWGFQCMRDDESGNELCTTEIATRHRDRDFLIYFAHAERGTSPLVVTGPDEPFSSMSVTVDSKDPMEADECEIGICYFRLEKSLLLLKQFKRGHRARISILSGKSDAVLDKEITLKGFSAAFSRFATR